MLICCVALCGRVVYTCVDMLCGTVWACRFLQQVLKHPVRRRSDVTFLYIYIYIYIKTIPCIIVSKMNYLLFSTVAVLGFKTHVYVV